MKNDSHEPDPRNSIKSPFCYLNPMNFHESHKILTRNPESSLSRTAGAESVAKEATGEAEGQRAPWFPMVPMGSGPWISTMFDGFKHDKPGDLTIEMI